MFMIAGMLPGTLLCVRHECILFVFFNLCGAVGFGAVMIAGASVIWGNIGITLCSLTSVFLLARLCSTTGSDGGTYGCCWRSPG